MGYIFLIIPGIIAQIAFHANAEGAEKRAYKRYQEVLAQCRRSYEVLQNSQDEEEKPDEEVPPLPEGMDEKSPR